MDPIALAKLLCWVEVAVYDSAYDEDSVWQETDNEMKELFQKQARMILDKVNLFGA